MDADLAAWATGLLTFHLLGLAVAAWAISQEPGTSNHQQTSPTPSDPPDQGAPPVTKTLLVAAAAAVALVYAGAALFDRTQADSYQAAALRCAQADPSLALPQCEQFKTAAGQDPDQPNPNPDQE